MKVEVLLATMFYEKENENYLNDMNIQTDIIIGNQTEYNENCISQYNNHTVQILSRNERGVGKNRNLSLFHSRADIILFCDNDVCYYDGYAEKIIEYFENNPKADLVIFNFKEKRGEELRQDINTKDKRARLKDIVKFGTWAVCARRESVIKARICFSTLFGGGAKYSCGEDTLFLTDCYKKGLKIYLSSIKIGEVVHKESTWFNGITEKYIFDKGALFKAMNPKKYKLLIYYHVFKHRKLYSPFGTIKEVIKVMLKGAKEYKAMGY